MSGILQDFRLATRRLRHASGFTATAILTLSVGIGFTTAMYALVQGVLLRPLRFPSPDRLVKVTADYTKLGIRDVPVSPPELFDYRDRSGVFDQIAGIWPVDANVTGGSAPLRVEALATSANYFTLLGAPPAFGRVYGSEDDVPGFAPVAVISDGFWHRAFGADPEILGRIIRLDEDPYEIIGVMPADFRHPSETLVTQVEVWIAAGWIAAPFPEPRHSLRMLPAAMGRLKPGVTLADAQIRLDALGSELRAEYPEDYPDRLGWIPRAVSLSEDLVGETRPVLALLMSGVVVVLLIACTNIANLLLARALGRERDVALRLALGAGRGRVTRELVVESLLLGIAGGIGGLTLSQWAVDLIVQFGPANLPRLDAVAIDAYVLGFTTLVSVGAGLLVALAPALQLVRPRPFDLLRHGGQTSMGGAPRARLRGALVVGEFSLALVLLVVGGLLLRSFWLIQRTDPGFDPTGVTSARVWLPAPNDRTKAVYAGQPAARLALVRGIRDRLARLPAVEAVGLTSATPLDGPAFAGAYVPEDWPPESSDSATASVFTATPGFFPAFRVPLARGRLLEEADNETSARVALVNETLARRFWPDADPVGKRIRTVGRDPDEPSSWITVVGVVRDVKTNGLDRPAPPQLYLPMYQVSTLGFSIVVRTARRTAGLDDAITSAVQALDANLPVFAVRTMEEVMSRLTATRRFTMLLLATFGVVAVALAALGLYGVMAYVVGQRQHEIGVRLALGASPRDVVRMVLSEGVRFVAAGVVVGVIAAFAVTRSLTRLLYGVSQYDPATFASVALLLVAIAFTASYVPARRAARVDPSVALRME